MAKKDATYVARVPLFERLTDSDPYSPSEPQPLRALTNSQLLDSVQRELTLLLNTRCPMPVAELLSKERSVIDYGLPDLSFAGPMSAEDQQILRMLIERTVAAFEPRLRGVQARIGTYEQVTGTLVCQVSGFLITETLSEAVSFPILMKTKRSEPNGRSGS